MTELKKVRKLDMGESSRSHSADEFVKISEMEHAFDTYTSLLDGRDIRHTSSQE